jgi:hypothetical protein
MVLWTAVRLAVLVAPFVLYLGARHFTLDLLGSPSIPDWAVIGAFVASLAAVFLAVHDFRALRTQGVRVRPLVTFFSVVVASPFVLVAMFLLINFLVLIVAIPYALALVLMAQRVIHRWSTGREIDP